MTTALSTDRRTDDGSRQKELDECLASVTSNAIISQAHVMVEKDHLPLPSFAELSSNLTQAEVSNRSLVGGFFIIFSNANVLFYSLVDYFAKMSDKIFDSTLYAISRRHLDPVDGLTPHPYPLYGGYDTFAFKPRSICMDK
ncbi:hypothetical protein BGZ54_004686 [Gamsiella multidivaricata]|nr:hypothetical protein BGZ54_004686 [Gamsiella multidivaricata]